MNFIKQLDARTLTVAGTSIALLFALWVILKITTNDIAHLEASIKDHNNDVLTIRRETNEVLRELTKIIEGNTKVIERLTK